MVLLLFDCPHKSVCNLASAMCVAQGSTWSASPVRPLPRAVSLARALTLWLSGSFCMVIPERNAKTSQVYYLHDKADVARGPLHVSGACLACAHREEPKPGFAGAKAQLRCACAPGNPA